MHDEKPSKPFTELLKKLGSKKTKAPVDLKSATTLENLFKHFLFILKPSVLYQNVSPIGKINSIITKTDKHKKKTVHQHSNLFIVKSYVVA